MKRLLTIFAIMLVAQSVGHAQLPNSNYREAGGLRWVIGGSLDVASGGEIDIESGGALKIGGTAMTSNAAELNWLDGLTAGTVTASKALVVGTTKDLDYLKIATFMLFLPHDSTPASTEGHFYYDLSEHALKFYNGTSWIGLSAGTGDNTLDHAYDQGGAGAGRAIDVDSGAVTLTVSDTDNNVALVVAQNDSTNDPTAMQITSAADAANAISLDIDGQATGRDIEGTGATWYVTGAGVGTFADVQATTATVSSTFTVSNGVTLVNGQTITGDTNNQIDFTDNSETLGILFSSNTVTLTTSTSIDALALGVIDDVSGIGTLAFDAAASSITLAADGAADDLTIQVTGAQDSSLVLASAGTGADAMQLSTSAGGIDITNGGAAAGEDLDLSSTNASINLTAGESATDAIKIDSSAGGVQILASGAAAGEDILITATGSSAKITATEAATDAIVLNASTAGGGIDITSQEDIDISTTGAAGEDITILNTGGSVIIQATEAATDAITLNASTAAGGIDITSNEDIDITTTGAAGEDITISNTGGSLVFSASEDVEDAIGITASTGGINITADGAAASDLDLACTNGSANLSGGEDAADAVVISAGAGGIDISATGESGQDIDILNTGGSVTVTATENDAGAIYVHANGGASEVIKLHSDQGTGADSIHLLSDEGGITLDAGADDDILCASPLDVDEAITGDGGAAITGMLRAVTNDADGKTVAIADAGGIETNSGAVGGGIWNLPEASTAIGMQFTFVCLAAQNMDVNPDDADQILGLTDGAGNAIRSATVGDTVTLVAVDATNWVVVSIYPTNTDWADVD